MIRRNPLHLRHVMHAWVSLGERGLEGVQILGPTQRPSRRVSGGLFCAPAFVGLLPLGWRHYLSNATCLIRPRSFMRVFSRQGSS